MAERIMSVCPVCGDRLEVVELKCSGCGTRLSGRFGFPRLLSLDPEQLEFIQIFLKCRGNIREVERELGVSYPTVRNRLEGVIRALGFQAKSGPSSDEILEGLSKRELSVDEAVELLGRR